MKCRKCHADIPDTSKYCMVCGAKQLTSQNTKGRGNGTGSVFRRGKSWMAVRVIKYSVTDDGKMHKVTRSKGGFKTKKEAIEYLPQLTNARPAKALSWDGMYQAWLPTHRAGKSTMGNYRAVERYFQPIWDMPFNEITIDDLQDCLDECPKGKRTRENMKALAGLLYKYAIPRHMATLNLGQYIIVGGGETIERAALPDDAVSAIRQAIGTVPWAEYVLCQCYLGFRPSELLALDTQNYLREEKAFVGGAKTDAGRDRVVTVSPKIQPIIDKLVKNKIAGPVFCAADGSPLSLSQYRDIFYSVLDACGIDNPMIGEGDARRHKYTPHSCRHTFATMMKRVAGADKDKLALIGHTSQEMLRHYQDISFDDLRKVTDAI